MSGITEPGITLPYFTAKTFRGGSSHENARHNFCRWYGLYPLRLAGQGSGSHATEGSGCGPSPSRAETGFVSSSSDERTQKLYRGAPDLIVSVPDKIAVEKLFSIKVSACVGKDSEAPRCIRVYAGRPMHGHGTNYKPNERKLGLGHSAINGMLFCMPGNWNLTFDREDGGKRQQLTRKVKIGR